MILSILVFFNFITFFTIRPYCNVIAPFFWSFFSVGRFTGEEIKLCVVVSPLFLDLTFCLFFVCRIFCCCRGDSQESKNYNSRSPLSEPDYWFYFRDLSLFVGEIHRRGE